MGISEELGAVAMGVAACYVLYKTLRSAGVRLPGWLKRRSWSPSPTALQVWRRALAKDFAAFAGGVMETFEGGDCDGGDGDADV
jgi:hypothetical protein